MDDNENRKQRIMNAMIAHDAKNNPRHKKPVRKRTKKTNSSPESDLVKSFLVWTKKPDIKPWFSLHVIESKAVFNPDAGRFISGQAVSGYPDISGCDKYGTAMFLEAKANGKRSTIKEHQYFFLKEKIEFNSFALCFDSIDYFSTTYKQWLTLSPLDRKQYLMAELHSTAKGILKKISDDDSSLFD